MGLFQNEDENVRKNWMIGCFRKYHGKEQGDSEYVHNNYTTITYTPEVSFNYLNN